MVEEERVTNATKAAIVVGRIIILLLSCCLRCIVDDEFFEIEQLVEFSTLVSSYLPIE